jgi:hypothetical protein
VAGCANKMALTSKQSIFSLGIIKHLQPVTSLCLSLALIFRRKIYYASLKTWKKQ